MRFFISCLFLFISGILSGQNLVFNPSFEIHDSCPYDQAQVSFATGWFDPNYCTSDYFNSCSTNGNGVPDNWAGSQPARTGGAYMGLGTQKQNPGREYVKGILTDTLVQGRLYCVEFYISLCGGYSSAAINQIGAYFSSDSLVTFSQPIIVNPQIESPYDSILKDTVGWMRIAGTFVANGTERYITIGNFRADSLIIYDTIVPSTQPQAYYYVDDISVVEISDCLPGNNVSICYRDSIQLGTVPKPGVAYSWMPTTGLSDPTIANPLAFPDTTIRYTLTQRECDVTSTADVTVTVDHGCSTASCIIIPTVLYGNENLFIQGLESNSKLDFFDYRGRLVFSQDDYQNNLWSYNLAAGMYIAQLTRPNGEQIVKKVTVIR